VFLYLFFSKAVEGQNSEQADASTRVFLYVAINKGRNPSDLWVLVRAKEIEDNEEKLTKPY
jgi:hypothetical protein